MPQALDADASPVLGSLIGKARRIRLEIEFWGWQSYGMQPCMAVTRIVANLLAPDPKALAQFYSECFGLDFQLDMGWITFLTRSSSQPIELHTASQGGSGTELPVISIGVDDINKAEASVRASGAEIVYGPINESWGLRRFYFRDPAGNLINVVDN